MTTRAAVPGRRAPCPTTPPTTVTQWHDHSLYVSIRSGWGLSVLARRAGKGNFSHRLQPFSDHQTVFGVGLFRTDLDGGTGEWCERCPKPALAAVP
ncbi:hypothetical protein ACVW19_003645 [Streptomyces sp. TE5632]